MRQFVDFTVLSYIPWWLTSPLSTTASWNDLLLLNSLLEYRKRDPVVANVALKSLKKTQWYLSEELVPLALFSKSVPDHVKEEFV